MSENVQITYPQTSITESQQDAMNKAVQLLEENGFDVITRNTAGTPCEPNEVFTSQRTNEIETVAEEVDPSQTGFQNIEPIHDENDDCN